MLKNRIILSLFFIFMFIIAPLKVATSDDMLYVVENILVDKSADNAVMARDAAITEGQNKAFEMLKQRILFSNGTAEQNENRTLSQLELSSLINDFETRDERFSTQRYRALLTVRFNPTAVRNYLSQNHESTQIVQNRGNPVLVLPFFSREDSTVLWNRNNTWFAAWRQVSSQHSGLVPLIVPEGDSIDMANADEHGLLSGNQSEVSNLLDRYNTDKLILPIAQRTDDGAVIEIYEYIGSSLTLVHEFSVSGSNTEQLWLQAINDVQRYMDDDWKRRLRYSNADMGQRDINMRVNFQSMKDWLRLRGVLEAQPLLDSMQVKTLRRDHAEVSARLNGSITDLENSLLNRNLILRRISAGVGFGQAANIAEYEVFETVSRYNYNNRTASSPNSGAAHQQNSGGATIPEIEQAPLQQYRPLNDDLNRENPREGMYEYRYRSRQEQPNRNWNNTYVRP